MPKRCGHFEDKAIVALEDAVERVAIAVDARRSVDTVIIARTDAVAVEGIDAAIRRARAFRDVGADVLFVEALESSAQLDLVAAAVAGMPLLYNVVEGGRSPILTDDVLAAAGVGIVIHPITLLLESMRAQQAALRALRDGGLATSATIALARQVVGADDAARFRAPRRTATAEHRNQPRPPRSVGRPRGVAWRR